jgi:hypothetical protein
MEGHLEVLLELCFFTKPLKFGLEAHMKAPTGVWSRGPYEGPHWSCSNGLNS